MRLYIFDRAPQIRASMRRYLHRLPELNINVAEAEVSNAVSLITDHRPEIVLIDFDLRGGSALDVLHHFRERDQVPVFIVMVNLPIERYRQAALDAGADYCVFKNFDLRLLSSIVRSVSEKLIGQKK